MVIQFLSLLATPLFFLGGILSVFYWDYHSLEMPLMWFAMSLAHVPSWLAWYRLKAYRISIRPNQSSSSDSNP